jgi:DNA repair protein RecO (recombination protein O)
MYFLEVTDYYTRENNDESDFLKLIYQSLKALLNKNLDNRLIRSVFEIKSMVIEGEFPGLPAEYMYSETAKYTVNFIVTQSVEKLYTFRVSEEVLSELASACRILQSRCIDRQFKSLEILPQV